MNRSMKQQIPKLIKSIIVYHLLLFQPCYLLKAQTHRYHLSYLQQLILHSDLVSKICWHFPFFIFCQNDDSNIKRSYISFYTCKVNTGPCCIFVIVYFTNNANPIYGYVLPLFGPYLFILN